MLGEEFFGRGIAAREFSDAALRAATAFEKDGGSFRGIEGTRGSVIGKRREECGDFGGIGGKGIPGVAVTVVDHRAGAEDLLDAVGLFADDGDDHVDELGETKGLPDDGAHADVAGVFVGVADGDLIG